MPWWRWSAKGGDDDSACEPLVADHDEIVCVVDGRVTMTLADEMLTAGTGTVLFIPRGTAHAVTNTDTTRIVLALSCFTPAFDGADRHAVEPPPAADH